MCSWPSSLRFRRSVQPACLAAVFRSVTLTGGGAVPVRPSGGTPLVEPDSRLMWEAELPPPPPEERTITTIPATTTATTAPAIA